MFTEAEANFTSFCLEGFFYGKISVPSLVVPLLKKLWFPVSLGLYSGIFAMYLQHRDPQNKSRTYIIFYALCVLYVLSTVNVVLDLLQFDIESDNTVSNNSTICRSITFLKSSCERQVVLAILDNIAIGCCDFLAQCILVRINDCCYIRFIHLNFPRSTVVGSCGVRVKILSASWSFLHSWQSHT